VINIEIKTIPHLRQRYPTCGDYYYEDGITKIFVSDLNNGKYEFLVAVHELIEEFLTKIRGVKEEHITEFDKQYEQKRLPGDFSDPGNDINAPYFREHQFATVIEHIVASEIGVNWEDYETAINNLDEPANTGC
jgi:hypothetical protein